MDIYPGRNKGLVKKSESSLKKGLYLFAYLLYLYNPTLIFLLISFSIFPPSREVVRFRAKHKYLNLSTPNRKCV